MKWMTLASCLLACNVQGAKSQPMRTWEEQCAGTGGTWARALVACVCPTGQIFQHPIGCSTVHLGDESRPFDDPRFEIYLATAELSRGENESLASTLRTDPVRLIRGLTVVAPSNEPPVVVKFGSLTPQTFARSYSPPLTNDFFLPSQILVSPRATQLVSDGSWARACQEALQEVESGSRPSTSAGFACDAAAELVAQVVQGQIFGERESAVEPLFSDEGSHCAASCAVLFATTLNGYSRRFSVYMQNYLPVVRFATVAGPDGFRLTLFANAEGALQGMHLSHLALGGGDFLLRETEAWFSEDLTLLHKVQREHLARSKTGSALLSAASDGHASSLGACLIDTGMDPAATEVWRRVGARRDGIEQIVRDEPLNASILGVEGNPWDHTVALFTGAHGAEVAHLLLDNAPPVNLIMLSARDLETYGAVEGLYQRWSQALVNNKTRVVNVSVSLSRTIANCEDFLGRLMNEHPNVLFVAGMGNSGGRDPVGACPASLAGHHSNLLTVAGAEVGGQRLDPDSNYGGRTAMVAASYSVKTLDVTTGRADLLRHGTSFSAPQVGNLALRLFERFPMLSPANVVTILMEACTSEEMDVACGGVVDRRSVEEAYLQ